MPKLPPDPIGWIRRNVSVLMFFIACGGLLAATYNWYATTQLLKHQVQSNVDAIQEIQLHCKEVDKIQVAQDKALVTHIADGHPATKEWRSEVNHKFDVIDNKLDSILFRVTRRTATNEHPN